jgi:tetratricopeptide (TPR) repeat protein
MKQSTAVEPPEKGATESRPLAAKIARALTLAAVNIQSTDAVTPEVREFNNRGVALAARGETERAIESYTRAIQLDPSLAAAYSNIGNALATLGRFEEAIHAYDRALETESTTLTLYNRASALLDAGRAEGCHGKSAINDQSKLAGVNPLRVTRDNRLSLLGVKARSYNFMAHSSGTKS